MTKILTRDPTDNAEDKAEAWAAVPAKVAEETGIRAAVMETVSVTGMAIDAATAATDRDRGNNGHSSKACAINVRHV